MFCVFLSAKPCWISMFSNGLQSCTLPTDRDSIHRLTRLAVCWSYAELKVLTCCGDCCGAIKGCCGMGGGCGRCRSLESISCIIWSWAAVPYWRGGWPSSGLVMGTPERNICWFSGPKHYVRKSHMHFILCSQRFERQKGHLVYDTRTWTEDGEIHFQSAQ